MRTDERVIINIFCNWTDFVNFRDILIQYPSNDWIMYLLMVNWLRPHGCCEFEWTCDMSKNKMEILVKRTHTAEWVNGLGGVRYFGNQKQILHMNSQTAFFWFSFNNNMILPSMFPPGVRKFTIILVVMLLSSVWMLMLLLFLTQHRPWCAQAGLTIQKLLF